MVEVVVVNCASRAAATSRVRMDQIELPQLACPSCGHSLRGLEPLPPALLLRCPECGQVTSISKLAAEYAARQREIRQLPLLALSAGIASIVIPTIAQTLIAPQSPFDRSVMIFAMVFSALISGCFTLRWPVAPTWARLAAMISGGAIGAAAVALVGLSLGGLLLMGWWWALHRWAQRQGFA
jgi:hypothetical protein